MSDTTRLRIAREQAGFSRELVTRRSELDPPISSKTLERWEAPGARVKRWRLAQLAKIYGVTVSELRDDGVEAVA